MSRKKPELVKRINAVVWSWKNAYTFSPDAGFKLRLLENVKKTEEVLSVLYSELTASHFIDVAKIYFNAYGFVTVPAHNKQPVKIKWSLLEERYKKLPSWKTVLSFWNYARNEPANGLMCIAGLSNLLVIDIDEISLFETMYPNTLHELIKKSSFVQRTPSKGLHIVFRTGREVSPGVFKESGFDVRAGKSMFALYPSTFPSKLGGVSTYTILKSFPALSKAPEFVYEMIDEAKEREGVKKVSESRLRQPLPKEKLSEEEVKKLNASLQKLISIAPHLKSLYRARRLSGFDDIDTSYLGALVRKGASDSTIHSAFSEIYGAEYNPELTSYMISRTRERINAKKPVRGLRSLLERLKAIKHPDAAEALRLLSK